MWENSKPVCKHKANIQVKKKERKLRKKYKKESYKYLHYMCSLLWLPPCENSACYSGNLPQRTGWWLHACYDLLCSNLPVGICGRPWSWKSVGICAGMHISNSASNKMVCCTSSRTHTGSFGKAMLPGKESGFALELINDGFVRR